MYIVYICVYGQNFQQSTDQPGLVANPARGQLNREIWPFPFPFVPENLVSREMGSAVLSRVTAHFPLHSG